MVDIKSKEADMIERILERTTLIEKALDASLLRNEAISDNLANIDTPKYKRKTVAFEEYLRTAGDEIAGRRTNSRHIPIGEQDYKTVAARLGEDNSNTQMRLDGNNVDIDSEMAQLAENSIKYNVLLQKLSGSFKNIKSVIKEGRG
jgi:flagellar basal-body rod protein FlgB